MKQKTILAVLLAVFSTSVLASDGGKNKNPWQPVSDEECSVFLPSGISEEKCEVVSVDQSGITYLCSGYTAFCPTTETEDD